QCLPNPAPPSLPAVGRGARHCGRFLRRRQRWASKLCKICETQRRSLQFTSPPLNDAGQLGKHVLPALGGVFESVETVIGRIQKMEECVLLSHCGQKTNLHHFSDFSPTIVENSSPSTVALRPSRRPRGQRFLSRYNFASSFRSFFSCSINSGRVI